MNSTENYGWPQPLAALVGDTVGVVQSVGNQSGIKLGGGCQQVAGALGSVVVKRAVPREGAFYRQVSTLPPALQAHLPQIYGVFDDADAAWIVMEDLPDPLPKERWLADREALMVLALLHEYGWGRAAPVAEPFRPRWDDSMTEQMLALPGMPRGATKTLRQAQRETQPLFAPLCWVQGDTNATNWRLRGDGSVVLVDWERIGIATPAIDVAVTIPGVGSPQGWDEARTAQVYLQARCALGLPMGPELANLSRSVRLAKCWNVVEYLAHNHRDVEPGALAGIIERFSVVLADLI